MGDLVVHHPRSVLLYLLELELLVKEIIAGAPVAVIVGVLGDSAAAVEQALLVVIGTAAAAAAALAVLAFFILVDSVGLILPLLGLGMLVAAAVEVLDIPGQLGDVVEAATVMAAMMGICLPRAQGVNHQLEVAVAATILMIVVHLKEVLAMWF
jgi:hypothetical protein